ncbi:unnamed protein product [Brassica oleracea var. botrytis]|uniref:RING-type E3 ubiquitin transferase n=2 Tax=Brassica oleracea var. oleracea TaxID=109376 RepID=A0A0D3CA20_BRAOL
MLPPQAADFDFFYLALLHQIRIIPDDGLYDLREIKDAIGFTPGIECNKDPELNDQVHQICLCIIHQELSLLNVQFYLEKDVILDSTLLITFFLLLQFQAFGLSTWELPLASVPNGLKDVSEKRVQNCEGTQRTITWKKNRVRRTIPLSHYSNWKEGTSFLLLLAFFSVSSLEKDPSFHSHDLCLGVYVMSSEAGFAEFSALFERMIPRGEGLSRFLPLILALAGEADEDTDQTTGHREIVIDQVNRRVVMYRSALGEFLNGDFSEKQGRSPASKSSVENLPRVVIGKDEEKRGSCPICLDEWSEGDVAAEMPCKHRFHSKCVEEWLGRHATCPLCRYEMPVEEVEEEKKVGV